MLSEAGEADRQSRRGWKRTDGGGSDAGGEGRGGSVDRLMIPPDVLYDVCSILTFSILSLAHSFLCLNKS